MAREKGNPVPKTVKLPFSMETAIEEIAAYHRWTFHQALIIIIGIGISEGFAGYNFDYNEDPMIVPWEE